MDFKELETLTIPQDFTGQRLYEVTREIIQTWPLFQLALEHNTYKFGPLSPPQQIDKITHLICALTISIHTHTYIHHRLHHQRTGFGGALV